MIWGMKHFLRISTLLLSGLALTALVTNAFQTNNLAVTCGDAISTTQPYENGHCTEGMVTFRGTSYPTSVGIKVLSYPAGVLIDSGAYSSVNGDLAFTQTLVPAGGYTIKVFKESDETVVYTNLTIYTDALN